jgi:hypothetical protein
MVRPTEFGTKSAGGFSMTGRVALRGGAFVPWRALALAVLVPLLVGVALYEGLLSGAAQQATPPASGAVTGEGAALVTPEARASISAALGRDIPAYHLTASAGALSAENAAQQLRIGFTRSGVLLSGAAGQLGLRLRAEGAGAELRSVGEVGPKLEQTNRVAYAHDGTTESYVNGPLGLEQGFSIARAPSSAGALTLAIGVSGASSVALAPGGQSALLRGAGGRELRYGGLSARDANGRALRTWMTSDARLLLLHVDALGARYPLVVDPMVETEPEQKLNARSEKLSDGSSGESERSRFGWSVALSADGNTALVGAPGEDGGAGAAWTFTRAANGWVQAGAKLTIPEATLEHDPCSKVEDDGEEGEEPAEGESRPCHFGRTVALSADGDTAVVGAPRENGNSGAVWTFTRTGTGTGWETNTELPSPEAPSPGRFGTGLALSADGSTLVVGAPRGGGGRVWTFTRSGSSWSVLGGPTTGFGEDGVGLFGQSVALSDDGQTLLVGAPADSDNQGAAWGFTRSGSSWEEEGTKLTAGVTSGEAHFGSSVALSGDASTALVGARGADDGDGAASAFSNTGTGWVEEGPPLAGGDEAGEGFGGSVALSFDGNIAVVGAGQAENHGGSTWLFERSGGSWGVAQKKLGAGLSERGAIQFGSAVALSADAETVLVGAHSDDRAGAAWVFGPSPSVAAVSPNGGPLGGGTTVTITGENLTGATRVRFGSISVKFTPESAKSITAVSPSGMGTVDVTVETPVGVSAINEGDRFTYKGGGGGGGGGAGNKKEELEDNEPLTDSPTKEATPIGTAVLSQLATGSETVVLAFDASAHPTCRVSLLSGKIAVQGHARALVKLKALGTGTCHGRLTLKVKIKSAKRRSRSKSIAAGSFSLAAGKVAAVKLALNASGRALLRAGHGHLTASLIVLKSVPTPTQARTAKVRLTRRRAAPAKPPVAG